MHRIPVLTLVAWAMFPAAAGAEAPIALSLSEAVVFAVEKSPAARVAHAEVDVAEADVVEARLATTYNPSLEVSAGPRFGDPTSVDVEVGISQPFVLGGVGRAAVAVADYDVLVARAEAAQARLRTAEETALAYLRALHAQRRLAVARESQELGARIADIAHRRFEAGESDRLQSNTARLALGRLDVEVVLWESRLVERLGELRALLGLAPEQELTLTSTLELPTLPPLEELQQQTEDLPEIAALRAAEQRELARYELGEALRWPELELGVAYAHEESTNIIMGLVSFTLPIFARGQAVRAIASARQELVVTQLAARRQALEAELAASLKNYQNLREAETAFRNSIVPAIEENEAMVRQAYEAGAVALPELLTMRAETIAARQSYVDLLLEVALAATHTRAVAGILVPLDPSSAQGK